MLDILTPGFNTMLLEAELIVHYVNFLLNNTNRMVMRKRVGNVQCQL
jgi:hypothetical protein